MPGQSGPETGAQPWITGPNFIFVGGSEPVQGSQLSGGDSKGNAPEYLGTAVTCPKPEIERAWRPIPSSLRGIGQQSEQAFYGEQSHIYMVLSRWNPHIFDFYIASALNSLDAGTVLATDIGQLLQAQGNGLQLAILFPYQAYQPYTAQTAGYRYLCAMPIRYMPLEEGGYDGNLLGLHFFATSVYQGFGTGWTLFDDNVPAQPPSM